MRFLILDFGPAVAGFLGSGRISFRGPSGPPGGVAAGVDEDFMGASSGRRNRAEP